MNKHYKFGRYNKVPIDQYRRKLKFISSFSAREWATNGHPKDTPNLVRIYDFLLKYVLSGNFLELGCGTGIVAKYLLAFSKKKIIPYGIDRNEKAIEVAKNNHRKYAKNFIVDDYFNLSNRGIKKFSTIVLYLAALNAEAWRLNYNERLIDKIYNNCRKRSNIIITVYDEDLTAIKMIEVKKFVKYVKMKYRAEILNNLYILIYNH